jgi:hypothetical protein
MEGKVMKKICFLGFVLICLPALILAQDRPTPKEARKVIDYYYNGKGKGAILMDYKLCKSIHEKGPNQYDCKLQITDGKVKKRQEVFLWMNFLVPAGDKAEILLQFKRKNKVRKALPIVLSGSPRYRTWKKIPTDKTGNWKVSFVQEMEDVDLNLGELEYSVVEGSQ